MVIFCPLSMLQCNAYNRMLQHPDFEFITLRETLCPCGSQEERRKCCFQYLHIHKQNEKGKPCICNEKGRWRCPVCHCPEQGLPNPNINGCVPWTALICPSLTILQNISNHIGLIIPRQNTDHNKRDKDKAICSWALANTPDLLTNLDAGLEGSFLVLCKIDLCGKMTVSNFM